MSKKSINQENSKTGKTEGAESFNITCSWCGTLIRSDVEAETEQMCLICHARMLNDYFQKLRKVDGGGRIESRRRP